MNSAQIIAMLVGLVVFCIIMAAWVGNQYDLMSKRGRVWLRLLTLVVGFWSAVAAVIVGLI